MPDPTERNSIPPGKLSADEAVQLAQQVAQLAKAGLPLGDGLRAWADELGGGRLVGVLREMADQIDRGAGLDAVVEAQGSRLPAHVRGLMLAGVRSGNLVTVLHEFVEMRRRQAELRRRIGMVLAYPILLLSLLSLLFLLLNTYVVHGMAKIFQDFGTQLPAMTQLVIESSGPGAWGLVVLTTLLVMIVIALFGSAAELPGVPQFLHWVPLIGPMWRFSRLAQLSRLMAALLEQETPLPEALRLAATGVGDADLAAGCRQVAEEVEAGRPLAESLASKRQFPRSIVPLVDWGHRSHALPDALRAVAEMMDARTENQGTSLESVLLPLTIVFAGTTVGFFVIAMFMPMISLVIRLT